MRRVVPRTISSSATMGFCKSGLRIGVAWVRSGVEWNCVSWGAVDVIALGWSAAEWGSGVSGVEWIEVERNGAIRVEMELAKYVCIAPA